ncbi:hypothetical protein SAMN05444279_1325 [Ruegeria intermedia]|uniref:Serine/threonine protein phosphatase 1 n=2 Tax=Ruegeria intermedia TaxID=996115 RepID=A0A1M5B3T3_9RHOB|nr:hypothetical protein SAMN05444279_1325 [Ruegeria intermedia]
MLVDRDNCFCIRGNHEEMLLAFLEDPITNGPRWLRYGGLQTLASYGISSVTETSNGLELEAIRDNLRQKMGAEQVFWLRTLPYCHRNGNVAVVHAGADPRVSLEDQFRDTLVWGHPGFGKELRQDGLWIAHGHTIVDAPGAENGVISVDIGAYATGRLCIAHIAEGEVGFRVVR